MNNLPAEISGPFKEIITAGLQVAESRDFLDKSDAFVFRYWIGLDQRTAQTAEMKMKYVEKPANEQPKASSAPAPPHDP